MVMVCHMLSGIELAFNHWFIKPLINELRAGSCAWNWNGTWILAVMELRLNNKILRSWDSILVKWISNYAFDIMEPERELWYSGNLFFMHQFLELHTPRGCHTNCTDFLDCGTGRHCKSKFSNFCFAYASANSAVHSVFFLKHIFLLFWIHLDEYTIQLPNLSIYSH